MESRSANGWTESEDDPGLFWRVADEPERFYATLEKMWEATGQTFFAITGFAGLSVDVPQGQDPSVLADRLEKAFTKAWRKINYDHPTLRSYIRYHKPTGECRKYYRAFPEGKLGQKRHHRSLAASLHFVNNGKFGHEICEEGFPVNDFASLYIVTPPIQTPIRLQRDVIFRSAHEKIDGMGTQILLENLFTEAAKAYDLQDQYEDVTFGDEYRNLSPSYSYAANIPQTPSPEHVRLLEEIKSFNATVGKTGKILAVPYKEGSGKGGNSQRVAISFDKSETDALLAKCREIGTTITIAFHTGIALAMVDLQRREDKEQSAVYSSFVLGNLRQACTPPFNTSQHPAAIYHSGAERALVVDLVIPPSSRPNPIPVETRKEEFRTALKQVAAYYERRKLDKNWIVMAPMLLGAIMPPYPETMIEIPPPDPTASVSISSLGVVNKIIRPENGAFHIHHPWITGDEFRNGVGTFLVTWQGEMSYCAVYNDAFQDKKDMVHLLESIRDIVFAGLEVDRKL